MRVIVVGATGNVGTSLLRALAGDERVARDEAEPARVNLDGSRRVIAAAASGARTLVHASSIGAYPRGPKDRPVSESHPTTGRNP